MSDRRFYERRGIADLGSTFSKRWIEAGGYKGINKAGYSKLCGQSSATTAPLWSPPPSRHVAAIRLYSFPSMNKSSSLPFYIPKDVRLAYDH